MTLSAAETKLSVKAKAKLDLLVEPINYVYIRDAKTAAEVWSSLCAAFNDSGLTRKVSLLRQLISTKLSECESIENVLSYFYHEHLFILR